MKTVAAPSKTLLQLAEEWEAAETAQIADAVRLKASKDREFATRQALETEYRRVTDERFAGAPAIAAIVKNLSAHLS